MPMGIKIPADSIKRVARMSASNKDAAAALGISDGAFGRICKQHGIESPSDRKKKERNSNR